MLKPSDSVRVCASLLRLVKSNDHVMESEISIPLSETFSLWSIFCVRFISLVVFSFLHSSFQGVRGNACHSSRAGAETPFSDRDQRTDLGFLEGKRLRRAFRQI